mmetsp:Transcript_1180/g.2851  ORF Transcript_1180/g.2851 Transcript_1180/m.2851 type:complete len:557 (-) Transcript_1180:6494-8164(-)
MDSDKNDFAFKSSTYTANDSFSDSGLQESPPHFLTEDRLRPSTSKRNGEASVSFDKENPQVSFLLDMPYAPSSSSSFIESRAYDTSDLSQNETPVKPPVKYQRDSYHLNLEDRPRSSNSKRDNRAGLRRSYNERDSGSDWSGRMAKAVDIKTQQTLQRKEATRSSFGSIMSYSPRPAKYTEETGELALQNASAKLTVKTIVAMHAWIKPNDAVCATGLGLMMLFCDNLPTANYWEEVQAYLRKPGRVIQQMRRLSSQIKCRLVDEQRFAMLRDHIACIDPNKVRQEDATGKANLIYDFLFAAVNYFEEVNPHLKDFVSTIRRVSKQTSKQSVSKSFTRSSQRTREESPTFNELPEVSYLPKSKSRNSLIMPEPASSDVVFATEDPEVIERYLERETLGVRKLAAERRKAEWEEVRDYKASIAKHKQREMQVEIERYRNQSRKNLREESLSRLSKVKEMHEHNASVLEFRKLFKQRQEADERERSMDEYGRSLAKWSARKASRSPIRPVLEDDLSQEEQNRVKSKIMELKQLHKQLQDKSFDERRTLSLLRGSNKLN